MGVLLLLLHLRLVFLLRVALQATTPLVLWRTPLPAAPSPGSLLAPRCSSSGSSRTSAASPRARAATAPYTCRLQGGGRGEDGGERQ